MGIHFSHILGIVWVSASPKIFEKPITLECLFLFFFPYFSRIMGIHFSHVLEIVWISASIKIFKKPINLKCLCFPILFPYYGNPLFSYVGNCMDFCFQQKVPETLNFEMFMFSYATHEVCKKPIALECLCFPILFPYYEDSVIYHVFGIVLVSISREIDWCGIYKKPKPLEYLCFPIIFPY